MHKALRKFKKRKHLRTNYLHKLKIMEIPTKASNLLLETKLPPEDDLGNVEYKIHVINLDHKRFQKFATQMSWRIHEGNGACFYHVGIPDDGSPRGISYQYMKESLENIKQVCEFLKFENEIVYLKKGISGGFCAKIAVFNNNSNASYS